MQTNIPAQPEHSSRPVARPPTPYPAGVSSSPKPESGPEPSYDASSPGPAGPSAPMQVPYSEYSHLRPQSSPPTSNRIIVSIIKSIFINRHGVFS